ncbi:hypothetical protein [Leuconostoc mesenteroides]|uniref:hypothetical protein n=1 Tax=Leuconostoc mesenteroides TaxID=1245 RepID=UPI000A05CE33|nr:hypothetical protein [Leuconostoc mesenteroides]ORI46961.1 hypothetical protein BMR95_05265 [Leuconostoc mesenteroides subsp. cremoris]ORI48023.1 hypothetical protein BMR97_05295 [Leuconostoc mesenteroides subsp. cremoris]ORI49996.1 hypothetical protein BMR98_05215 [Leuconostoc mesenteroides subsp. cremoris]ORI57367.1 hypothetical protein BMS67_03910 [Leuconostoc mesenteroides subsp. cremoris]ORI60248.1 hypothetical protein BMS68_03765 [Leuconostoc mesenteroides subsp. cremoris]
MSKTKVFIAGVLATTAAYVAYKALPKDKQDELSAKAHNTGALLRDKAYDAAYNAAGVAADVTEKAKEKTIEKTAALKTDSQEKYADQIDAATEKIKDLTDQAAPYVDKAKDFVTPYIEKTQDALTDLRDKFANEDIELTQDDVDLEEALADLADDENVKDAEASSIKDDDTSETTAKPEA